MPSLDSFTAFVRATGVKIASTPDDIVNDAVKNTYWISRMLKGRDAAMSVQAGQKIADRVQLSDVGTAGFFSPNDDMDIQNVDSLVPIEVNWRFIADHFSYTEQEVTLNSGDAQTYYKNLLKSKRQACTTSIFNKKETALWDVPSNSGMEAASGKVPYSIPSFITADGLAPSGFTTLATINPTNETGWRNQVETYNKDNINGFTDGLLRAMRRIWHKVRFESPQGGPREYFESDRLQKMAIATNLDGMSTYEQITADANDRLTPANNPGWTSNNVNFAGIPFSYVSTLDTALLNSGAAFAEGSPPYYYQNFEYLFPFFHTTMYMKEKEPMARDRQPFSYVVWKRSYYNLFCKSRKRQGMVSAAA